MVKFSVGVKPSTTIIDKLARIDNGEISTLYGSIKNLSILPSVREHSRLDFMTIDDFKLFIGQCHEQGWTFAYTINAKCLSNDFDVANARIFLHDLCDLGVDTVIVSNTFIMQLAYEFKDRIKMKISTVAEANSIRDIHFFRCFNPDSIVPSLMCNRDFAFLESITYKDDIELLVNEVCLYECPWRADHYNIQSHGGSICYGSFPYDNCFMIQSNNLAEFIKARFIRPEDLKLYEDIGFSKFKITGRTCHEDKVVDMTKAYLDRSYDGNLLDLFPIVPGKLENEGSVNIDMLQNKALDGFLADFPTRTHTNFRCDLHCGVSCKYCNIVFKRLSK